MKCSVFAIQCLFAVHSLHPRWGLAKRYIVEVSDPLVLYILTYVGYKSVRAHLNVEPVFYRLYSVVSHTLVTCESINKHL